MKSATSFVEKTLLVCSLGWRTLGDSQNSVGHFISPSGKGLRVAR